ncbi:Uncharacterised protein [Shigella sonnei]|nr:Uncharacterised protein [Shigella sonnei]
MAKPVGNNTVLFRHHRGNDCLIRGKTRDKQQRPRIAKPLGQFFFQRLMHHAITADMPGTAATYTKLFCALLPGADNLRMMA